MSMICDNANFYNRISAHDEIMDSCSIWTEFYNFMAGNHTLSDRERQQFEYEMSEYLCYDV